MPSSPAALAARVQGARPFPAACVNVLTLTSRDDFDARAVVAALEQDPPMTARMLRLVNSSAFSLRQKCSSVAQAVSLLGARGVRAAVLAGSVLNLFPGKGDQEWNSLHDHATHAATLARHLAPEWKVPADEMFTTAFLHDIGKWVLLDVEPEYGEVLTRFGHAFESTLDEERGRFGFDHAELAEHMLLAWNIPQPIPKVVGLHHDPAEAYGAHPKIAVRVALLRLSDCLARAMERDAEPDFEALARGEPFTYLQMSAQSLRDRYASLRRLIRPGGPEATADASGVRMTPTLPLPRERRSIEVCAYCDGASFGQACRRCGARLCDLHAPGPGKVCGPCEDAFSARMEGSWLGGIKSTLALAGAGLATAGVSAAAGAPAWAALVPGVALLGAAGFGVFRRYQSRAAFLAEEPPKRPDKAG